MLDLKQQRYIKKNKKNNMEVIIERFLQYIPRQYMMVKKRTYFAINEFYLIINTHRTGVSVIF